MENQFKEMLRAAAAETGLQLQDNLDEVALYASERVAILAMLVGQDGYDQAVIAERDNVALKMALASVAQSDAMRDKFTGLLQGALFMAAGLIAPGGGSAEA